MHALHKSVYLYASHWHEHLAIGLHLETDSITIDNDTNSFCFINMYTFDLFAFPGHTILVRLSN